MKIKKKKKNISWNDARETPVSWTSKIIQKTAVTRSQLILAILGCVIWRRKGCTAPFGWVFGVQLGLRQTQALINTYFITIF